MSEAREVEEVESLGYATPSRGAGSSAGVGFALMFGGLGLVFLGGCFLVGVLILHNVSAFNAASLSEGQVFLLCVLYLAAFACFGGAVWLIGLSVRHMLGGGRR